MIPKHTIVSSISNILCSQVSSNLLLFAAGVGMDRAKT